MKRYGWLLGCCLFLSIGMLWAADEPDLRMLQQKAAQSRDMEGYVGVCKYLYQTEENPELLLLYADSIHQLATKSKKPEQLVEYYIWASEGNFIKGDFQQGYALKRKAIALAEKISGSESAFVDAMTAQLKEWSITDAKLYNASGLNNKYLGDNRYPGSKPDDENSMSALDVAIIADHLIKDYPQVLEITKQTETDFEGDNKLTTHNYMLEGQDNYREGVDGLKTGTTELAGASFVAHSNENGMSLITVVMNADNGGEDEAARFTATNELLDYVTQNWEIKTLNTKGQIVKKNDIKVADGDRQTISAKLESDLTVIQKINSKNDAVKIKAKTITAPIKKGDTIGTATFDDKNLVGTGYISEPPQVSVTANQSIKKSFFLKVWWNHIVNFFTGNK